jgi:hypothetical protein
MAQPIPGALQYEVGRSNSDSRVFFGGMPLDAGQINPDYIQLFDDFTLLHGKAFNATDMWSVIKDAGASVAVSNSLGGIALLSSTATTDNDGATIQMTNSCIARTAGKKLWFEAQVQVSDIDSDIFVGLAEAIATNPEDVILAATHRIGISVYSDNDAGTGLLQMDQSDGTTNQVASLGVNMVAATYKKLGFYYDGSTITFYVDRVAKLSSVVPAPASGTALMGPTIFHLSGNNVGTDTLSCDYVFCMAER